MKVLMFGWEFPPKSTILNNPFIKLTSLSVRSVF